MASRRTLKIEVIVDEKGAVKGVKSIGGAIKGLEKTSKKTSKSGFSLGQSFNVAVGNVMANAVALLAQSVRGLIRAGAGMIKQGSDIIETQSKFSTVFGTSEDSVQSFLETWGRMAGITETVGQEFLSTSGFILKGAGIAESEIGSMSIGIAQLAGDLTSFMNVPIEQSFQAINSALTGETERLKSLNIVLKQSEVINRARLQTGKENAAAITSQEKAIATLALIAEKAAPAMGDLEKTQFEVAAQTRQLEGRIAGLKDVFALELIPGVKDAITGLNEFAQQDEVEQFVKDLGESLSDALKNALDLMKDTVTFITTYKSEIKTAAEIVGGLTIAIIAYRSATALAIIVQNGLNLAMTLNPIGAVVAAIAVLIAIIIRFRKTIADAASVFVVKMADIVGAISGMLASASKIPVFGSMIAGLAGIADTSSKKLFKLAESLDAVGESVQGLPTPGGGGGFGGGGAGGLTPEEQAKKDAEKAAGLDGLKDGLEDPTKLTPKDVDTSREVAEALIGIDAELREATLAAQQTQLDANIAFTEEEKRLAKERSDARLREAKAAQAATAQIILANSENITSAKDAARAVVESVKQAVKARLAEAIASQITNIIKTVPFPFNIAIAAAAGAAMGLLFSRIPSFEHGVRNFAGGEAIVGEKGPERVLLPRGSHVMPAFQTNMQASGGGFPDVLAIVRGDDIWLVNQQVTDRIDRGGLS